MQNKVGHILSGDLWGGAHVQVLTQLLALKRLGWTIPVFVFRKGLCLDRFREAGIECTLVEESAGFWTVVKGLKKWAKDYKLKIVVTHGYKEAIAAACLVPNRIKLVTTFHGLTEGYSGWAWAKMFLYEGAERFIARGVASRIVTVSKVLARDLGFFELKKTVVIRNVVEFGDAYPPSLPEGWTAPWTGPGPHLGVVGRLVPVKRGDVALRAFLDLKNRQTGRRFPDAQLHFIGEGPERPKLEALVAELELSDSVHFWGFREDAPELIKALDLLIISSDSEGIPSVLLEAFIAGTPVAATDLGGIIEISRELRGARLRIGRVGHPESLAKAMGSLLERTFEDKREFIHRDVIMNVLAPEVAARAHITLYEQLLFK